MIDFGDLDIAEEVGGDSVKSALDAERRAWESAKEEKRRADESEREERMRGSRVKYAKVLEAKALRAERKQEKEQAAAGAAAPAPEKQAPAPQAKTLTGKEERKNKYKWLLQLDEAAMKVVHEHKVLETPEEEDPMAGVTCWRIITAGPTPDFTDIKTLKAEIKKSDILSVFGPPKAVSSRKSSGRFSAALAKGGLAALNYCKHSKNSEDMESTADASEISTADPTEAWEGSEEDLSTCDGRSEPDEAA